MKDSVLLENQKDLLIKRSLHTIRILKENEQAANEPIAVIGMACRFPGGCSTPEKFWNFLKEKGDGVTEVPRERWDVNEFYDPNPGTPGKMYIRQACFLKEDIREFDARFFRISPLEASEMDPQQRLLLEVSWEAIERAGQNMDDLKDSNTGVFIGIIGSEYSKLPRDNAKVNPYKATGSLSSIASGRISHILGFHGPAISVDTTCSSSLVSLHLACESLKKRTCDMALAGG
jgi:acyl transferase domain-containing protein